MNKIPRKFAELEQKVVVAKKEKVVIIEFFNGDRNFGHILGTPSRAKTLRLSLKCNDREFDIYTMLLCITSHYVLRNLQETARSILSQNYTWTYVR